MDHHEIAGLSKEDTYSVSTKALSDSLETIDDLARVGYTLVYSLSWARHSIAELRDSLLEVLGRQGIPDLGLSFGNEIIDQFDDPVQCLQTLLEVGLPDDRSAIGTLQTAQQELKRSGLLWATVFLGRKMHDVLEDLYQITVDSHDTWLDIHFKLSHDQPQFEHAIHKPLVTYTCPSDLSEDPSTSIRISSELKTDRLDEMRSSVPDISVTGEYEVRKQIDSLKKQTASLTYPLRRVLRRLAENLHQVHDSTSELIRTIQDCKLEYQIALSPETDLDQDALDVALSFLIFRMARDSTFTDAYKRYLLLLQWRTCSRFIEIMDVVSAAQEYFDEAVPFGILLRKYD